MTILRPIKRIHAVIGAIAVVAVVVTGAVLTRDDDTPAKANESSIDPAEAFKEDAMQQALEEQERLVDGLRQAQPYELRVTIREESPYDAYAPGPGETCVRATNVPAQLVIQDDRGKYPSVVAELEIPSTARLTADGACEARIKAEVPFATKYRLGVAIEGHGISSPTDPGETYVKTTNSPQKVVVLR
jgi:hypothetical protein